MKVFRGFKFTNIRGQIRVLLDGAVSDRPFFLYGAKFERYTGQKNKGPVRHALRLIGPCPSRAISGSVTNLAPVEILLVMVCT
jgi:hypothetical protein